MIRLFKYALLLAFVCTGWGCQQNEDVVIKLFHTTDIHGNFFPFDFINNEPMSGGMARVSTFMKEQRAKYDNVLLVDGGDLLQGQPSAYYYNYIDTTSRHLCSQILDYLDYDLVTIGNHDLETGHSVYDRWIAESGIPILGGNAICDDNSQVSYLPAYATFIKDGVKIAIVGMITPAIPAWLPKQLWSGMYFEDIDVVCRRLLPQLKEQEQPDFIIGLFHSGVFDSEMISYKENVGMDMAQNFDGFDLILCGHDHIPYSEKVDNVSGDSIWLIDPANNANYISDVTITVRKERGKITEKHIDAKLVDISTIPVDEDYMKDFASQYKAIEQYVDQPIGEVAETMKAEDGLFGPSTFVDFIHQVQLGLTNAEISLVAPLSIDASIDQGTLYTRDLFKLYPYENMLYTMEMTGHEIRYALEFCYAIWVNRMEKPGDHLLLLETDDGHFQFQNPPYAFDSAAGIRYTVDVTKPIINRVNILSMADGTPFDPNRTYKVAVNSYQGSGGASVLTAGAGISVQNLPSRILAATEKDMRYYIAEYIREKKIINPQPLYHWKFVPESLAKTGAERDRALLIGD
ncbi:MAG: bifunctional metallophosphatase/5'-nucleotidase [Prevotellaceae bacterium]|jgi:2',3'-cyclic-nucleotide 2'-phosphodiesterase/3'-nucleotidase|nr:bifunctional metallophosphatase/5'-nucleotidase [Prevotellaceae bacterium]